MALENPLSSATFSRDIIVSASSRRPRAMIQNAADGRIVVLGGNGIFC